MTPRPVSHRITAVGFIVMMIAGNFWLVAHLLGSKPSKLVSYSFELGAITVAVGGLIMLFRFISSRF